MTLRPTAPGECLVIPKAHIDHFTDIPDEVAQRIMVVAQRIGRRMRSAFPLERVGFLAHGYGVAHAHLIIVPQPGPHHLTSDRFARIVDGRVAFSARSLLASRGRVVDANRDDERARDGRADDGRLAPWARRQVAASFGSRQSRARSSSGCWTGSASPAA